MWRIAALAVLMAAVILFGFSLIDASGTGEVTASALMAAPDSNTGAYERAIGPWDWQFPADHGPHPDFQTEWWYYTGNLADSSGRRFGFQFTIFRRAIAPRAVPDASEWRTNQVYMAHFTVTDVAADAFHHSERFSRASAGLAGATADPLYRVWLEDWSVSAQNPAATLQRIQADAGDYAIDLTLAQDKLLALEGDHGLSPKGPEPGQASYYYSLTRLLTDGTVTVGGQTYSVQGTSWMDHEFSSGALSDNAVGWDWFGLQLDDGRDLMVGKIRLAGGGLDSYGGLLVDPDGHTQTLTGDAFSIAATGTWTSPHSGATYPSGWDITVQTDAGPLALTLTPLVLDQELDGGGIVYWEGAVRIGGDATGYGYAELTGYAEGMAGRF